MLTIVKKAITDTIDTATEEVKNELPEPPPKQRKNWVLLDLLLLLFNILVSFLESLFKLIVPPYEKPLYNETVLITGGGGGIGRALAHQFASHGATVICLDNNEAANKETVNLVQAATGSQRLYAYTCDVSSRENVHDVCKKVEMEVGHVSILINNAGILRSKQFSSHTQQDITSTFGVNVFAHFWTLECLLPNMRKFNHGHVVAVCSLCGVNAIPNVTAYCASKFAVRGLMESLYEEVRAENPDNQVKFTSIYPYMVDTGLVKKPKTRFPELMKLLTPEEVADQVVKAVRQDIREISVPTHMLQMSNIFRLLPNKVLEHFVDFMDTGVDPDD